MNRRQLVAGMLGTLIGGCYQGDLASMSKARPEKIRLVPDNWHILNVGRLSDGRLFWVDSQLGFANGVTTDFVCTFMFDPEGHLIEHSIELIGERGAYPSDNVGTAIQRHLAALEYRAVTDIWVRLFNVESHGRAFGLIPRQTSDGEWRVEFMPGNTLSFYAPWDAGEYDT